MLNAWIVMQREYLERVRTRAFLISTIVVPLFMFAAIALPTKLATMKTSQAKNVVLVTSSAEFGEIFRRQLGPIAQDQGSKFQLAVDLNPTPAERESLRQRVTNHSIDAFIWAPDDDLAARKATFTSRETSDLVEVAGLRRTLSSATIERNLTRRGLTSTDVTELLRPVELETIRLEAGKESKLNGPAAFLFAVMMVLFLYTTLIMYGVTVMRSVLEEKSSRIVEVLLASVSPQSLMAGKILGVGAVGLTQVLIWAIAGALLSTPSFMLVRNAGLDLHVQPLVLIAFPVFFLLGYLLYSASFAALGAAVNSEQEAQQFQIIVMLPIILSIVMMNLIIRQPNTPMSIAFSLFPFTSPILMYLRIVVQQPPLWQVGVCVALLILTTWGMMLVCARIYRVGILMYGKRPTLPEIMKWLKYA